MRNLFIALVLFLASSVANATITTTTVSHGAQQVLEIRNTAATNKLDLIEASATNGSPTVTIPLDSSWEKLRVFVFVTYVASTYVTVAMSCSLDGTDYGIAQTRAIAAGTATLSNLSDYKALGGADRDFMVEYDVRGCHSVRLTLGGDNTDVADLQAVAVR